MPTPWASACRPAPLRHSQSMDSKHPLPDQYPRQGPNGDEPTHPGLQPLEDDPDPRRRAADPGDPGLIGMPKTIQRQSRGQRVFTQPRPKADMASPSAYKGSKKKPGVGTPGFHGVPRARFWVRLHAQTQRDRRCHRWPTLV
jgi:hypothetical protein